jgi:hypothetical protein
MSLAAPLIYTVRYRAMPLPLPQRMVALASAMACLLILAVACWLRPNPAGYGSHTFLPAMQKCQFLERTGLPCPSCGMTTSFTWFVRGNLLASFYVQPMGALLAMLTACWVWIGVYIAITGKPVYRLLWLIPARYYLVSLLAFAIAAWGWKILIHLNGIDGWRT